MIPMVCLKLILVALLPLAAATSPADKLDPRYVSQLRVELRNVARPEQCLLFWKGVSEKLQDVADYSLPGDGADFELLADLSRMLKFHRAYHKLSEFVDECSTILRDLPKDKVASHTASRSRALELPTIAPAALNQQELDQLKKETQVLQEELGKKDKLLKDLEAQTRLKLDKLNVALLAREQQLQEAIKARDQEASKGKELGQENLLRQLEEQKKQTESREKQLVQDRENSVHELDKFKKELDERSKAHELKLELLEKMTKEKEQLVGEIAKLKVELESREQRPSKVEADSSLEAEQRKFQQDRKEFTERIELLEAEVKSKTELEKGKCTKKLQEVLKEVTELKEKVKKKEKCQRRVEDHDEPKLKDMMNLYDRVFSDASHPLDPSETLELLKVLEKMLKGHKDSEAKARYKVVDQILKVSKLKQKRCSKGGWDKLKELIQRHPTSISIQQYLQFWFVQRQGYCSRFYPHMMQ